MGRTAWFDEANLRNEIVNSKDAGYLNAMSNHKDAYVRMMVASNSHTSEIVLRRLAEDDFDSVSVSAMQNPSFSQESIEEFIVSQPDWYFKMYKNPNCSFEQMSKLWDSMDEKKRAMENYMNLLISEVKKRDFFPGYPDEWVETLLISGDFA